MVSASSSPALHPLLCLLALTAPAGPPEWTAGPGCLCGALCPLEPPSAQGRTPFLLKTELRLATVRPV